ncbi:MAG TPA: radical SAM protein [Tepidisphaeraceae bacterium]|nr:radical SAM protein [Tepidisphaeraceae bacterium]
MAERTINLFTLHSRHWQSNRYVYPVISRRSKGLSIGVNLNPDKACNFDCIYCSVDRSAPPVYREVDLSILRDELEHMVQFAVSGEIWKTPPFDKTPENLRRINDIAFSGDGEPTSYPQLTEVCDLSARLLQQASLSDVKLVLITNATLLHRPNVRQALEFLDQHNGEIWAKLEAGTEDYYRLIERTTIPLSRVLDNIRSAGQARPIVIQSLFMNVNSAPPSDHEINEYISRLKELKRDKCQIKLVQVYTVARAPAEAYVTHLAPQQLDTIAARVREIPLPVETYYGPD